MRKQKIILTFLLITTFASLLTGCARTEVPDIMEKEEVKAVEMVKEAGLIPIVEYEYREDDEKGKVFKTRPKITASVKKNTEVVIYVSKGPEKLVAKNAYCKWTTMGKNKDKWEFTLPYVDKDVLYIDCHNVVLSDGIKWEKSDEDGISRAEVSLTEEFDIVVPAKVKYEKEEVEAYEPQHIIFAVPLEELKEEKPANLSFRIPWEKNGDSEDFRIDFNIIW